MKTHFFFLFLLFNLIRHQDACEWKCPSDSTQPPPPGPIPSDLSFSPKDEIINGINYGPLIYFNNLIFLTRDVGSPRYSILQLHHSCPAGYRPPTEQEYASILSVYNEQAYQILNETALYNPKLFYLTSTKSYPTETSSSNSNIKAFYFRCLAFNQTNARVDNCNTYYEQSLQRVKCVFDTKSSRAIEFTGIPKEEKDDLVPGQEYSFEVNSTNVESYSWNFVEENLNFSSNPVMYTPANDGCKVVVVKISLFGGVGLGNCVKYYVTSPQPRKTELYELSEEDEIANGINIGKLIVLNNNVWLTQDVTIYPTATSKIKLTHRCPKNYRPPTMEEIQGVLTSLGNSSYLILTRVANYSLQFNYSSDTKSTPNDTKTYYFKGIYLYGQNRSIKFNDINTFCDKAKTRIKCIRSSVDNIFTILGPSQLTVGQNYTFEIVQTNSIAFNWNLGTDGGEQTGRVISYIPQTIGQKTICAKVTILGGGQKSRCFIVTVN